LLLVLIPPRTTVLFHHRHLRQFREAGDYSPAGYCHPAGVSCSSFRRHVATHLQKITLLEIMYLAWQAVSA
jgi:hypothetical protein